MSSLQKKMVLSSAAEEFNLVSEVTNNTYLWRLRIRVVKVWAGYTNSGKEPGLDLIMIDKQGTPIYAKIVAHIAPHFANVFEKNDVYEIYRFNAYKSTLSGRPVKHEYMLFFNANTVVTPAHKGVEIPLLPKFSFVHLSCLDEHLENRYLIDVIGVIMNWSSMKRASSGSVYRDVLLADRQRRDVRLQLWDREALAFDTNHIPKKATLIITSAAVTRYEQGGSMKLGLTSKGSSMVHINLNIPESAALQESDIEVNLTHAPRQNVVIDWRKGQHSSLQEIALAFKPYSKEETYVARVQIVSLADMYSYDACHTCNTKVDTVARTRHCRKHGDLEKTKPSGFVKVEIADATGQQTVTVFGRRIRELCKFDIEELVNYRDAGVDVGEFFLDLKDKTFLFELKLKTYQGAMSLSASKIELDNDEPPLPLPENVASDEAETTKDSAVPSSCHGDHVRHELQTVKRKKPDGALDDPENAAKLIKPIEDE